MAGHSHWSNIKRTKEADSQKRALLFSKLSKKISLFAKDEKDPQKNPNLRIVIEEARRANMPKDNIEKAIKRGSGEIKEKSLESFLFEFFGPLESIFIVEGITDNIKRTVSNFKTILSRYGSKLAESGSVKWNFDYKGLIIIEPLEQKEKTEILIIESGADDFIKHNDYFEVYTKPENIEKIKLFFEKAGIQIIKSQLVWVPKEIINVKNLKEYKKFVEALEENEDVQQIYSNVKLDE